MDNRAIVSTGKYDVEGMLAETQYPDDFVGLGTEE